MLLFFWPVSDNRLDASACYLAVLGLNVLLRSAFCLGEARGDPEGDAFGYCSKVNTFGEVDGFLPLGGRGDALLLKGLLPPTNDPVSVLFKKD